MSNIKQKPNSCNLTLLSLYNIDPRIATKLHLIPNLLLFQKFPFNEVNIKSS